jgi:hypothetical protein
MLGHALGLVDAVVFRVSATNYRSRKAMEKIGAFLTSKTEEWAFHGDMIPHVLCKISRDSFQTSLLNCGSCLKPAPNGAAHVGLDPALN